MTSTRVYLDGKGAITPEGAEAKALLAAYSGRFVLSPTIPDMLLLLRVPALGGRGRSPRVVLAGDASGFPLSDLIAFLSQARWSGVVRINTPAGEKSLGFKEGEVRSATSDDTADRLGEVIVRLGYASRIQLENLLKESPPSKVGRAMVEAGLLQAHDLYKCVNHQVSEIFHAMLLCREGVFALLDEELDDKTQGMNLQLSTQSLLMDAIRKIDELAHFRHRIPHGRIAIVRKRASDGKLEEEEDRVLQLANGERTVLELGQAARLGEFDITKVVFRLLEGGYATVVEPAGGAAVTASPPKSAQGPVEALGEGGTVVRVFNEIFREILLEVEKQGMAREFLASANAALAGQSLTQSPVLRGVAFQPDGVLPEQTVATQYQAAKAQLGSEPLASLRRALSDVMFFLLFQAGELLEARADEDLARRVKELLAMLGE